MAKKEEIKKSISITNRKASHEYHFIEKFVTGIVLTGTEIKSIRLGRVNLQDAYCLVDRGEIYVQGLHISPYEMANAYNHEAVRIRKLLMQKREINKLENKLKDKGVTIVVTKLFINDRGWVKLEIALAKGKKLFDKREDIKDRDVKREMAREKF